MNFSFKKNKKAFLVVFLALVVLSLNFFSFETRSFFYSFSFPFQNAFWKAGVSASQYFGSLGQSYFLEQENRILESRALSLLEENIRLRDLLEENKILRQALDLELENDFALKFAEITGKSSLEDSVFVDKGKSSGMEEKMPLITAEKVLFGFVNESYEDFSSVYILTHKDVSFNAKIQGKEDIQGIVKGEGGMKAIFDLIPREAELEEGDLVVTTGTEGIFPPNIVAGVIKEIEKDDAAPFKKAIMEPYFDLNSVKWLFAIADSK